MKLILALTTLGALVLSYVLYRIFIPILKSVKLGQKILDVGPRWHKSKEGTPIMGGLFFGASALAATLTAYIILSLQGKTDSISVFAASMAFAAVNFLCGFIDDYIKLFKKRNKGLSASGKLFIQIASAALYLFVLAKLGYTTELFIPFIGNVELGIFYYPLVLLGIVYIVNCVNLNDGIDGLCGSITLVISVFFTVAASMVGSVDALCVSLPLAGALIGFLYFNIHPAKIFMGDTGSLLLGGTLVAVSFILKMPAILVICGFVYIFEGLSVMLQVASFKLTGKRIFKMSPIHHHFEMCGWSEAKIVTVFSLITAILCVISYFGIKIAA